MRREAIDFLTKPCRMGELEQALGRACRRLVEAQPPTAERGRSAVGPPPAVSLEELERRHILQTLDRFDGDRDAATEALGISRRTLYYRLARYRGEDSDG